MTLAPPRAAAAVRRFGRAAGAPSATARRLSDALRQPVPGLLATRPPAGRLSPAAGPTAPAATPSAGRTRTSGQMPERRPPTLGTGVQRRLQTCLRASLPTSPDVHLPAARRTLEGGRPCRSACPRSVTARQPRSCRTASITAVRSAACASVPGARPCPDACMPSGRALQPTEATPTRPPWSDGLRAGFASMVSNPLPGG